MARTAEQLAAKEAELAAEPVEGKRRVTLQWIDFLRECTPEEIATLRSMRSGDELTWFDGLLRVNYIGVEEPAK